MASKLQVRNEMTNDMEEKATDSLSQVEPRRDDYDGRLGQASRPTATVT